MPRTFAWGAHVQLAETVVPDHIRRILEALIEVDRLCYLVVQGGGLDLLERDVNGESVDWGAGSLVDFVRHQLRSNRSWAVVFEPHSDQIDRVETCDVEGAIQAVRASLVRRGTRQGFVAVSADRRP